MAMTFSFCLPRKLSYISFNFQGSKGNAKEATTQQQKSSQYLKLLNRFDPSFCFLLLLLLLPFLQVEQGFCYG
ncbi:hypothetical protein K1719_015239 [Acacia pycnantha]|nr:hypothetical protein K1719_015044 [Acacia pycnantha]KAI9113988.1 hypothetical protein K1719_015239 [Acacia pycnantha]